MAEPLTFLFRFQDDGSSPAGSQSAPVGAKGGQAAASAPAVPQRRRRRPASVGSAANQPRTRAPGQAAQAAGEEKKQRAAAESRRPTKSAASEVFDDLIKAIRRIPGPIGKTVGLINDLAEPFQRARRRYRELLESHAKQQPPPERPQTAGSATAAQPSQKRRPRRFGRNQNQNPRRPRRPGRVSQQVQRPARRRRHHAPGAAGTTRRPRQPAAAPPGSQPQRGLVNPPKSPVPSALSPERQALQKLIDALGPLPANQRELIAALRPLKDFGYKTADLKQGLHDRRERLRKDAEQAAQQQPNQAARQRRRRQVPSIQQPRVPHRPGAAAQTARGAASTAAQAGAAADAGAAVAKGGAAAALAGVSALPGGIVVALAAIAVIGAATIAFDALVSTVKKVDAVFVGLSQKLAPFSGRLAMANAMNSAKNTISDVQSAQAIGDKLAKYMTARGDTMRTLQRILDVLEGWALDAITPVLEAIPTILEEMLGVLLTLKEFIGNFQFSLNPANIAKQLQDAAIKAAFKVEELLRRKADAQKFADAVEMFFGGGLGNLIIDGQNFGSGQKPIQPAPIRLGPIPPAGIGGI